MVPDVYGWAHDYNARGVQKYSKHSIAIHAVYRGGITPKLIRGFDVLFFSDIYCLNALRQSSQRRVEIEKKPIIVYSCGTKFGKPPPYVKVYGVCTEVQVKKCKDLGVKNYALLREGVDTEVFKPTRKHIAWVERVYKHWRNRVNENLTAHRPWSHGLPYSWWRGLQHQQFLTELYPHLESRNEPEWFKPVPRFLVGWAGNPKQKLKRYELAKRVKYPIKAMTEHGVEYFRPSRSRQPMVNFYNSVDAYIMLMSSNGVHGCGLTLMEAMACSVPVVATDIAGVSELVPREWLVPENPDETVLREVDKRLTMLDEDRSLLKRVGASNRELILRTRAWSIRVEDWDRVFEEVAR